MSQRPRRTLRLVVPLLLFSAVHTIRAEPATTRSAPVPNAAAQPRVVDVYQLRPRGEKVRMFGLNTVIVVDIEGLKEWEPARRPERLIPYIGDIGLRGHGPLTVQLDTGEGIGRLTYHLERDRENGANLRAWAQLLKNPNPFDRARDVGVTVGTEEGDVLAAARLNPTPQLEVFPPIGWLFIVLLLGAITGFTLLARRSDILRDLDAGLPAAAPAGSRLPYSLAKTQLAFWFFAVLSAFVCLWIVTGDYRTLSTTALGVLGISSGTAVTAALIDVRRRTRRDVLRLEVPRLAKEVSDLQTKVDASPPPSDLPRLQATLAQRMIEHAQATAELNAAQKNCEPSRGFIKDLLDSSGDGTTSAGGTTFGGVSLHRFQVAVWTVILIAVFLVGTYQTLAMPEFGGELLALMGISSGTYLVMKPPEGR